jgi:Icc-related predicted phosphoesterase
MPLRTTSERTVAFAVKERVRLAAVGDLHCSRAGQGRYQELFSRVAEQADVLLLCGDLTDYGLPDEARILAREIGNLAARIPVVGVLGNHDYESGKAEEVWEILSSAGITLLDGDTCEFYGIGFAGVKGFAGGFGARTLRSFGEPSIKAFVREAVEESLKLETSLANLRTEQRVALLHYAPIEATIEGEGREIYPLLGTSRLEDPFNRYPVSMVFHGHAHYGTPEGRTRTGVPVYNVAMPLLSRRFPDRPGFKLVEVMPAEPLAVQPPGA